MGFTADFYVFSKKENSTARPSQPSFSHSIVLTDECSIINPSIIVQLEQCPSAINYCYINEFGRYYFINNWVWKNGRWFAELNCDVLATYRNTIANSELYFLRTSQGYDGNIIDTLYPAKKEPVITSTTLNEQWWYSGDFSFRKGYWILGIVSKVGMTEYYAMNDKTFRNFCDKVLGTIEWANLNTQEISDNLTKALFNPFQYVVSCMWFPDLGSKDGWFVPKSVDLGWWSFDTVDGTFEPYSIPDNAYIEKTIQLVFSDHPQAISRGNYLNKKPYRYCYLYINPWGCVEVDTNLMNNTFTGYDATMRVDLITGMGILRVVGKTGDTGAKTIIAQNSTQFGVPVQLSDLDRNIGGALGGTMEAISGLLSYNFLGMANGFANAISDSMPKLSGQLGNNGSVVGMSYYPVCETICYEIVDEDNSDNGRPYCKNGKMVDLKDGFYIAENGSIPFNGTKQELESIKSYLESGVYYA